MKITDALRGEHGVFYAQFTHLEALVDSAATAPALIGAGRTMAVALLSHAQLENEVLFPVLGSAMGEASKPIAVMRDEHERIEGALAKLGETTDRDTARALLTEAIETARGHFAKEENVLFAIAEAYLSEETLCEMGRCWAARRQVTLATEPRCPGGHEPPGFPRH